MAYTTGILIFIILAIIWTIPWKIYALWRAARNNQKAWFIVLIFINTLAILELVYIYEFQEDKNAKKKKKKSKK